MGFPHLLGAKTQMVLPVLQRQRAISFRKQPHSKPQARVSGREKTGQDARSTMPGALVSIAMVLVAGRNQPGRGFRETPASSPRPGAAPPGLTRLPAP